jgi:hypothetical protein
LIQGAKRKKRKKTQHTKNQYNNNNNKLIKSTTQQSTHVLLGTRYEKSSRRLRELSSRSPRQQKPCDVSQRFDSFLNSELKATNDDIRCVFFDYSLTERLVIYLGFVSSYRKSQHIPGKNVQLIHETIESKIDSLLNTFNVLIFARRPSAYQQSLLLEKNRGTGPSEDQRP